MVKVATGQLTIHKAVRSLIHKTVMSCPISYHNVRQKPAEAVA